VPLEEFEEATRGLAQRLANGPTRTYALIKKLIYTSAESDLQTSMRLEGELQDTAFETEDHQNAVMAFLQKRKPEYKGR
jgi:2-(1,2-epoxy-1,2-dihydrophenyl)acetyl-CoA isomerase